MEQNNISTVQTENNVCSSNEIKNNVPEIGFGICNKKYIKLRGKNKKFDEKLYLKYDQPARQIIKEKLGEIIKDNPDIYAEDLILNDEKCSYKYIELQVCANWIQENYPYNYPFVYERKGHFSDDTLFIIFNRNMTKGLIFDKKSLNKEPKRIKKYSKTFIYDVPWRRVLQFYIKHFDIDMLRSY